MYCIKAYHNEKFFCIAEEQLTYEQANTWLESHPGKNGWTYYLEKEA